MRRIRKRSWQCSPSNDLDGRGDPIPPRYQVGYEIEDGWGNWRDISEAEAQRLLARGRAVLV